MNIDKEETLKKIKARQQPHQPIKATPPICPFMSTPDKEVSCNPDCKLYRKSRHGYECYFQEMQSISWNTRRPPTNQAPPNYPPQPPY